MCGNTISVFCKSHGWSWNMGGFWILKLISSCSLVLRPRWRLTGVICWYCKNVTLNVLAENFHGNNVLESMFRRHTSITMWHHVFAQIMHVAKDNIWTAFHSGNILPELHHGASGLNPAENISLVQIKGHSFYRMPGIFNSVSTRDVVKPGVRIRPGTEMLHQKCPWAEMLLQNFTQNA